MRLGLKLNTKEAGGALITALGVRLGGVDVQRTIRTNIMVGSNLGLKANRLHKQILTRANRSTNRLYHALDAQVTRQGHLIIVMTVLLMRLIRHINGILSLRLMVLHRLTGRGQDTRNILITRIITNRVTMTLLGARSGTVSLTDVKGEDGSITSMLRTHRTTTRLGAMLINRDIGRNKEGSDDSDGLLDRILATDDTNLTSVIRRRGTRLVTNRRRVIVTVLGNGTGTVNIEVNYGRRVEIGLLTRIGTLLRNLAGLKIEVQTNQRVTIELLLLKGGHSVNSTDTLRRHHSKGRTNTIRQDMSRLGQDTDSLLNEGINRTTNRGNIVVALRTQIVSPFSRALLGDLVRIRKLRTNRHVNLNSDLEGYVNNLTNSLTTIKTVNLVTIVEHQVVADNRTGTAKTLGITSNPKRHQRKEGLKVRRNDRTIYYGGNDHDLSRRLAFVTTVTDSNSHQVLRNHVRMIDRSLNHAASHVSVRAIDTHASDTTGTNDARNRVLRRDINSNILVALLLRHIRLDRRLLILSVNGPDVGRLVGVYRIDPSIAVGGAAHMGRSGHVDTLGRVLIR